MSPGDQSPIVALTWVEVEFITSRFFLLLSVLQGSVVGLSGYVHILSGLNFSHIGLHSQRRPMLHSPALLHSPIAALIRAAALT